jgi:hypothetical protein
VDGHTTGAAERSPKKVPVSNGFPPARAIRDGMREER